MKHTGLYLLLMLGFLAPALPALAAQAPVSAPRHDHLTIETAKKNYHFTIDIAETPEQQAYGLMHRKNLPGDYGMLFILPEDRDIAMWMKDTPSPLDMLFIDSHGNLVAIAQNTTPGSTKLIRAGQPVRAVLELAGGTVRLDDIRIGDKVIHSYFRPGKIP